MNERRFPNQQADDYPNPQAYSDKSKRTHGLYQIQRRQEQLSFREGIDYGENGKDCPSVKLRESIYRQYAKLTQTRIQRLKAMIEGRGINQKFKQES